MKNTAYFSSVGFLGIVLGLSVVLSTIIGAYTFNKVRSASDVLSVTGSASINVTSDQVKWISSISRQVRVSQLSSGYSSMEADLVAVQNFFRDQGIDPSSITVSPIWMDEVYDYRPDAQNREKEYTLRQTIEISSPDVHAVTALAQGASSLARRGIIFQTRGLEYYYSDLPSLRVSLLSDAIVDAKARASEIAGPSGQKVGRLKSASSGVVQVMPLNSVEISDYGAYDTSSIEKRVMVTVRASFNIR